MSDVDKTEQDWDNYWQGRNNPSQASALVNVEKHEEIRSFWIAELSMLQNRNLALDLACGAGTVAQILVELDFPNVHAVDISENALNALKSNLDNVTTKQSALENLPYESSSFDIVVSQYGFEYGETENVIEQVSRIIRPGGRLLFLSHKTGGAIHTEVNSRRREIQTIQDIGYFDSARKIFAVAMGQAGETSTDEAANEFKAKRVQLEDLARRFGGLAQHLLNGSRALYDRRMHYDLADIYGWLDGMENEIARFIGRMKSMEAAALDENKVKRIETRFRQKGIDAFTSRILRDNHQNELGWILSGTRSGN